jgi:hypothetical protein
MIFIIDSNGKRFLGYSKVDEEGHCYVTEWYTFMYLPLIPLRRLKIKRFKTKPQVFDFQIMSVEKLKITNILSTLLYGYILFPLLICGSSLLCIRDIADKIGIPPEKFNGLNDSDFSFGIYELLIIISIIWIILIVYLLKKWDEKRGLPEYNKDKMSKN